MDRNDRDEKHRFTYFFNRVCQVVKQKPIRHRGVLTLLADELADRTWGYGYDTETVEFRVLGFLKAYSKNRSYTWVVGNKSEAEYDGFDAEALLKKIRTPEEFIKNANVCGWWII